MLGTSEPADRAETVERPLLARETALLLIDVINALDFEGSEPLVQAARSAVPPIVALRARCRGARIPVVYVNDNFDQWRSDFRATVEHCSDETKPGHEVTRALLPGAEDYFVLKPRHSAFFCSPLEVLLDKLGCRTLILVGFATNICVQYTANDAHMRGYRVVVPADCTASNSPELTRHALEHMQEVSCALIETSARLELG